MNRTDVQAARRPVRLRPILMTTLAMVFGMVPLAFAPTEGSEQRAPMGQAVIGGVITSPSSLHPGGGAGLLLHGRPGAMAALRVQGVPPAPDAAPAQKPAENLASVATMNRNRLTYPPGFAMDYRTRTVQHDRAGDPALELDTQVPNCSPSCGARNSCLRRTA